MSAFLRASPDDLYPIRDMSDATIARVKISEAAGPQISYLRVKGKPVLTHWMEVKDYCISKLAHEPIKYVMVLCLDSQNRLIIDETVSRETVNQTAFYPREIINLILRHLAHAVIFVRNHPGAETNPSRADIEITKDIKRRWQ